MRRYFIMSNPNDNAFQGLEMCIGALDTQRYSLDDTMLLIKTNQHLIDLYLGGDVSELGVEYSYEAIKEMMNSEDWTALDDLNI